MIDFACKQFKIEEVIKCGLGLSRAEQNMLNFIVGECEEWFTADMLAKKLILNLSTVQRGLKKLADKDVLLKRQNNLEAGGYIFVYKAKPKAALKKIILDTVNKWSERVEKELNHW